MSERGMTMLEYKVILMDEVEKFFAFWHASNGSAPEDFPMSLPNHAEWDEQFRVWQSTQD
jgi:hypothetical protein